MLLCLNIILFGQGASSDLKLTLVPSSKCIPCMVTLRVTGTCRFLTGLLVSCALSLPLPCPPVPMWLTKTLVIWFEFISIGLTQEALQFSSVQSLSCVRLFATQ